MQYMLLLCQGNNYPENKRILTLRYVPCRYFLPISAFTKFLFVSILFFFSWINLLEKLYFLQIQIHVYTEQSFEKIMKKIEKNTKKLEN